MRTYKNCHICKQTFLTRSGNQIYCDSCKTVTCSECHKEISRKTNFRPKVNYFCSTHCSSKYFYRNHPELKEKLKKSALRGEKHQFWKGGVEYRKKAFGHYGVKCQNCGYDKYPQLLWVHHVDFSKRKKSQNNDISNLKVLCIRCHLELHILS